MTYLHSFWTRPKQDASGGEKDIVLQDFEALTWLVSALEARRHGRIKMLTDTRGRRFLQRTGLDWIYHGGVSTALDDTPADIHPKVFWTAGRMFAFGLMDGPFASVDTDAILWQPLRPTAPVMALHHEDRRWVSYASNRADFGRFGFAGRDWNWRLQPVNLGVVSFPSPAVTRSFSGEALRFMSEYSAWLRDHPEETDLPRTRRAPLFLDQRLLPLCMARLGLRVKPIGRLNQWKNGLARNPLCSHLWLGKRNFLYSAAARTAYVNHLIAHTLKEFPEARDTLLHWKLAEPQPVNPRREVDWRQHPPYRGKVEGFFLIGNCDAPITVTDAHTPAKRNATSGTLLLPGETAGVKGQAGVKLIPLARLL
ncbi:MAG: hypothetical protein HZA92_10795 [Verrucomicrobia bacterium]|nr:hypothetical protein [Verrucomicrobiota bacterium]